MPLPRPEARDRHTRVRRVLTVILFANLAVVGSKLFVAIQSGSLAILGGALDSAVDALTNVLAIVLVRVAGQEPDEDHPYGHGKFETLGTLAIVAFLAVSCFELARGAVNHLASGGRAVLVTDLQLVILVLTLGVNVLTARYEQRRGAELGSELLIADAAHTRTDVYVTVGVLTGVLLARHGWWWADPVVAIGVALLIVRVAYRILARAVPVLVDERALPPTAIQETAEGVTGVKSAYGIRSRGAAPVRYAEVTIAVDRNANVQDAHAIADAVEERLKRDFQLAEVTVHVEPC
jgi:cation diffusion facilitator family transporter